MISDDEYLERVVAGIHAVTTADADVNWNEKINGRQFDVVVRFKIGTLRYLVLIEVKDRIRKASASDVEAFILKARDKNANKYVFVTAAGFQKGAVEVAKRHGAELFMITFDSSQIRFPSEAALSIIGQSALPNSIQIGVGHPRLGTLVESVELIYTDGRKNKLPDEHSQMNYYTKKSMLSDGRTLDEAIRQAPFPLVGLNQKLTENIKFDPPQFITPPDNHFFSEGILSHLSCLIVGRMGRPIEGNVMIDPGIFTEPVIYTNAITDEKTEFNIDQLPLGDKRISVDSFYFIMHPLIYYYCREIRGDKAIMYIIESFQNGDLLRGTIKIDLKYSFKYIKVSERSTLKRLRDRLAEYKALVLQE